MTIPFGYENDVACIMCIITLVEGIQAAVDGTVRTRQAERLHKVTPKRFSNNFITVKTERQAKISDFYIWWLVPVVAAVASIGHSVFLQAKKSANFTPNNC